MSKVIPLKNLEDRMAGSVFPPDGSSYVIDAYNLDGELFTQWLNKADINAKREGFGGEDLSMWIAANFVNNIKVHKIFSCYYCCIDFLDNPAVNYRLEHFMPGIHEVGNIVVACEKCDTLKQNRVLKDYISYLKQRLEGQTKHFTPLILRHYGANLDEHGMERFAWLKLMNNFAIVDFKVNIEDTNRSVVVSRYAKLYRDRYYPVVGFAEKHLTAI